MNLDKMNAATKLATHKQLFKIRKHSPTILMTAGIAGMVGTVVLASRATLQIEPVIEELNDKLDMINQGKELELDNYTEEDQNRDKVITYSKAVVQVVKLYLPAMSLGVASIGAIVGGQRILNKRNVALAAAYTAMQNGFEKYRERVVAELGEEKERELRYPTIEEKRTVKDEETGEDKEESIFLLDPNGLSIYSRLFDELNENWQRNAEYNRMFVQSTQNHMNDLLHSRGYVFLNEVYSALGIPETEAGQVVGWTLKGGDGFVDFGIFNQNREAAREFVNGHEKSILLDFNVDGYMLDKAF